VKDNKVAKRYATALYNEAVRNDVVQTVEMDLASISNLIHSRTEFRDFLMTPEVAREEKVQIAERLFSDRVTALTMQFLRLVLEKRRESEFETIREEFVEIRRENSNVIFTEIISAKPLDDIQRTAIETKLQSLTGKRIEAAYDVDPSLIGGVKVAYGNFVLDGTVKGSLRRLQDTLRHDLLKQF
jgi:F-type H+-transporting ATPase subunit delta